ncbi:MAG: hypothetical protein DI536_12695 [Archangium gephyra]|uniref:Thiol oxidoreductase n=1 Tax=Archangium gephyra TaxID=48 RepID=A0A2W5TDJ3_9BACT|nr:MAG: hypothetical protein DI536_12695 [Archangium gephyra]
MQVTRRRTAAPSPSSASGPRVGTRRAPTPRPADASGEATASEWRTAPLWGVGSTLQTVGQVNLLHDGRARSVTEAVLWHGGEAQRMRDTFASLNAADREALVTFVESL